MDVKGKQLAVMLTAMIALSIVALTVPVVPVQNTTAKTRSRPLQYIAQQYGNQFGVPIFVNVTNTDTVGGVFSVRLELAEPKPVVGGVEFEGKETKTQSLFIDAGATGRFSIPEEWAAFVSRYTLFYFVTPPTIQESYNVTTTEYKSVLSMIIGS